MLKGIFYQKDREIRVKDQERNWLASIRFQLLRLGILAWGELKNGKYHVRYPKELDGKKNAHYFHHQNMLYSKIHKVKEVTYTGDVFDFNMENNHNYLTDSGLVHNSGKRPGAFALYIEPHHPDVMEFLDLKKNTGNEEERARDLFYAMWLSDLFMERVKNNQDWSLLDPDECPGLQDAYGEDYNELYEKYEKEGKARKVVKARALWKKITDSQIETGVPYILYKDHINKKNNQKNVGTIRSSNLCVAPDTMILTSRGYYPIGELENQKVEVWNGTEFSETVVRKTGENQKLLTVHFSNGMTLNCTEYHKFYIQNGKNVEKVEAKELLQRINEYHKASHKYFSHYYDSDIKAPMPKIMKDGFSKIIKYDLPIIDTTSPAQYNENEVPINANVVTKIRWLNNFLPKYCRRYEGFYFHLDEDKAKQLAFLLHTIGINPTIECDVRLKITNGQALKLYDLGVKIDRFKKYGKKSINKHIKIDRIEDNNIISDTYCFNEEKKHAGVFNGILTSQCAEIVQYSDANEASVCNLASLSLPAFVIDENTYDHKKLIKVVKVAIRNLNKIIDLNFYPIPEAERSNLRHRPVGLGVQGLADTFIKMRVPFDSEKAKQINLDIFETIYYAALEMSCQIAQEEGPYSTFEGSPISQGLFQFDLWGVQPSDRYDWNDLRERIKKHGVRNSLLVACMPTASTSQLLGNNETIEPFTSNIYTRRTLAGDFIIINKYLIQDLIDLNLWNKDLKQMIIANNGSIQNIDGIPDDLKELYKTAWELKQKALIDLSIGRGPFVCQTQSLNLFFEEPTNNVLSSALFYGWKNGLKTGSYYIRSRPKVQAQQFTIDPELKLRQEEKEEDYEARKLACSLENPGACEMCSG